MKCIFKLQDSLEEVILPCSWVDDYMALYNTFYNNLSHFPSLGPQWRQRTSQHHLCLTDLVEDSQVCFRLYNGHPRKGNKKDVHFRGHPLTPFLSQTGSQRTGDRTEAERKVSPKEPNRSWVAVLLMSCGFCLYNPQ